MLDKLKHLVENTSSRARTQVLKSKHNQDLYAWVLSESSDLDPYEPTVAERIHFVLAGKPDVLCPLGNKRTLNKVEYGFCGSTDACACFRQHLAEKFAGRDVSTCVATRTETWLKKYGVDNPSRSPEIQQKRLETIAAKDNTEVFAKLKATHKAKGFDKVIERVRGAATPLFTIDEYNGSRHLNQYQWECVHCNSQFLSHVDYGTVPRCEVCFPRPVSTSKGEQEIVDFIRTLIQEEVITNTKQVISPLELDIYIPSKNIAIEFNGIYWHSANKKPADYHVKKFLQCRDKGIHLIQIFDFEWYSRPEVIKERLRNVLGVSHRYYARNTSVRQITSSEYRSFTEATHLRGHAGATHKYGLWHREQLIAVMSFSKSRYTADQYELVRYCSIGTVVGGASKLLKQFVRDQSPNSIVTYADRCWSNGNLYRAIGFVDVTANDQNTGYWYVKDGVRFHRSSFTKAKLVAAGHPADKTEAEIMASLGYTAIYDCGNYKFLWSANKKVG